MKTQLSEVNLDQAIQRTLSYLSCSQLQSGEFPTYWSSSRTMSAATYAESPFITGMIMLALATLEVDSLKTTRRRAVAYLLTKRKSDGLFSFFDRGIDPDLDDTCLLNWILQSASRNGSGYKALAQKILQRPTWQGLYGTWLRSADETVSDIDPCVNVNVLRFLQANGLTCEQTIQAIRMAMRNDAYAKGTLYYDPAQSLPYLVLTLPPEVARQLIDAELRTILQQRRDDALKREEARSILDLAMELFILASLGGDLSRCSQLASSLLSSQRPDGSWASVAMFRAFNYWGSAELTTAVVVQALNSYRQFQESCRNRVIQHGC